MSTIQDQSLVVELTQKINEIREAKTGGSLEQQKALVERADCCVTEAIKAYGRGHVQSSDDLFALAKALVDEAAKLN